jgi:hypothetical protein
VQYRHAADQKVSTEGTHGGKIAYDALPFRKHFSASAFSRSVMSELSSATTPQVSLKHLKHLKHWTLGFGCFSIRQCGASIIGIPRGWIDKVLAHQDPPFVGPGLSAVFSVGPQAES